ncbi:MAG: M48 family metallopeptidase [Bacteroidaceae bacterium]|nr:M48 family metallopeptidase [Bacteroidaceae bacterium]MDO4738775.1 M48 family metallopeptidase [Bacteroidales bacterium]
MQYIGIQSQIARNNWNSFMLLLMFPFIILGMLWVFCCIFGLQSVYDEYGNTHWYLNTDIVNETWLGWAPWAVAIVAIWLLIAYTFNAQMIQHATGAKPLERRENPRIYNMVENLCMTCGMDMPKINIINDPQLNAFASGINKKSYTVTLTTGIINYLDDQELEGVIAHELTHIRNRDTKVLIISIVFVGILSTLLTVLTNGILRMFLYGGLVSRRSDEKNNGGVAVIVVIIAAVICASIAYFLTMLTRFAISRKREFMADAGGAEMTRNPLALASALRKISGNPGLGHVGREDVAQLFIIHPKKMAQGFFDRMQSLFSTHPSTEERIRILEQF